MEALQTFLDDYGTLIALALVIGVSGYLGLLAERAVQRGAFVKGYFLGNRGLGVWAMALTATVQSGGTFVGFPSLVYSHGWIVLLWICSYMVTPLVCFSLMGKRLAQLSRRTGAVTLPDMLRGRFDHAGIGLVASLLLIVIMSAAMIAQFKAGAVVMQNSMPGSTSVGETTTDWAELGKLADGGDQTVTQRMTERAGALELEKSSATFSELGAKINQIEHEQGRTAYLIGLGVFTITVVGYTLFGGFLASVWTDLFQSVLMLIGVLLLVFLVLTSPEVGGLSGATEKAVANTGERFALPPGYIAHRGSAAPTAQEAEKIDIGFLPFMVAACYVLFMWPTAGTGSAATIVRVMASKDASSMRRSIFVLAVYNFLIYVPLIFICIGARAVFPDLANSDETIPRITIWGTDKLMGGSLWAGLVMAAPFGAVMATVSTYLVVIASGLVHDVYQRFIRPGAPEREVRLVTYGSMILVGIVCVALNVKPVKFLQEIIVFSGSAGAVTFLIPTLMACYWRRATTPGAISAMVGGFLTVLVLFSIGAAQHYQQFGEFAFKPARPLSIEPLIWGLAVSTILGIVVSLASRPPKDEVITRLFDGNA